MARDVRDEPWFARRAATTVVSLACGSVDASCFCTAVGLAPDSRRGSDVVLFPLAGLGDPRPRRAGRCSSAAGGGHVPPRLRALPRGRRAAGGGRAPARARGGVPRGGRDEEGRGAPPGLRPGGSAGGGREGRELRARRAEGRREQSGGPPAPRRPTASTASSRRSSGSARADGGELVERTLPLLSRHLPDWIPATPTTPCGTRSRRGACTAARASTCARPRRARRRRLPRGESRRARGSARGSCRSSAYPSRLDAVLCTGCGRCSRVCEAGMSLPETLAHLVELATGEAPVRWSPMAS